MDNLAKTVLFVFLVLFLTSWAGFVLAQVTLEVSYPETTKQTLTATTSLPAVIKYFFYFFIIIAVLLTVFSLIYGGILYLSSTGSPAAMQAARKRIIGSLLGLAILLGSYLLLQTLNPQLTILRVKKVPVETGVLLLNDKAYMKYKDRAISEPGEATSTTIQKLLDAPAGQSQAVYLAYDMADLREIFGEIETEGALQNAAWEDPEDNKKKYNFKDFKLEAVYFLPEANTKVLAYRFENYGREHAPAVGEKLKNEYYFYDCSKDKGPCKFKFIDEDSHVPMSIGVKGIGRGIYLYPDISEEEIYLQGSMDNLEYLRFDDETERIEIRNRALTWGIKEEARFIAVLHDDAYYEGKLRLFFEKFESDVEGEVGNLPKDDPATPENEAKLPPDNPATPENEFWTDNINDQIDAYGKVNKASSAHVFQLDDTESSCKEVRLCTGLALSGDCLSYKLAGEPAPSETDNIVAEYALPVYKPKNVPEKLNVERKDEKGQVIKTEEVRFADNIRSMKIRGECLVVLFENAVKTVSPFWEGGEPGGHSQVFFLEDNYPDFINKAEIGRCNCWSFFANKGWSECDSCVSAIAIYPVK